MYYGNRIAINNLINSLAEPSNYLFTGPKGCGKFTVALEFSKALLSSNLSIENNPDFFLLQQDSSIKKEDVSFIIQECCIRPQYSNYKIFLIDNADTATPEAQNALLKVLEDYRPWCKFILINHSNMLSTIESRLNSIRFTQIEPKEFRRIIDKLYTTEINEFEKDILCAASQGCIGTALNLAKIIIDFSKPFEYFLKKPIDKLNTLDSFGMLSEKKETGFYYTYSSYALEILNVIKTIFLDFLKINNGIQEIEFISCNDYLKDISKLFSEEHIKRILDNIDKDERLIIQKKYDKNAFFETINLL